MADDPRTEAANEARYVLDRDGDLWRLDGGGGGRWVCLTTESCSVHPADLANVCGPLRELVPASADPLRALLADEDRAVEFVTEVQWNAKEARMQDEFGRTPRPWTSVANYPGKAWRPCCENWRAETRKAFGPVLAALREVAGL